VDSIFTSFITRPGIRQSLLTGFVGEPVRVIQEQLNAISNHYPAISKVRVDGIFGEQTRAAAETFQDIFRLPADGIVGV